MKTTAPTLARSDGSELLGCTHREVPPRQPSTLAFSPG